MAQGRRGCGCALAALLAVLAVGGIVVVKFFGGVQSFKQWVKEYRAHRLPTASGKELQVHLLDVGLGDSILIVAPSGKTVLVDAGPPGAGKRCSTH